MREGKANGRYKHGDHGSKEYYAWRGIISRTHQRESRWRKYYYERGIFVCESWASSYSTFLSDMGRAPSKRHSIDRIDNSGPYCPFNCRWALPDIQAQNSRRARLSMDDATQIALMVHLGASRASMARKYGVSNALVGYICTGKNWIGSIDSAMDILT